MIFNLILLVGSLVPVILSGFLISRLLPVGDKVLSGLQMYILSIAQMVVTILFLSFFDAIYVWSLLFLNVLILFGVYWLVKRKDVLIKVDCFLKLKEMKKFILSNKIVSLILFVFMGLHIVNFFWALKLFPLFGDAEAYHLPRAYFWSQLNSLDFFPSSDARQNELPINSNLLLLWLFLFGKNYSLAFLPQYIGAIVLFFASFKVVKLAKVSTANALLIAAIICSVPQPVLQSTNASNDIILGALGMITFLFGIHALKCDKTTFVGTALTCGLAAGLAIGVKVTGFALIGAILVPLFALALKNRVKFDRLIFLTFSGIVGFLIVGSYQYVKNYASFGHPFYSQQVVEEHGELFNNTNTKTLTNLSMTVLQSLDFQGLVQENTSSEERGSNLRGQQRKIDKYILDVLDVNEKAQNDFLRYFDIGSGRADWNGSGYGVIGFLSIFFSPFILFFLIIFRKTKGWEISAALLTGFWIFLIGISALVPWNVTGSIRYLMNAFPLVCAGTLISFGCFRYGNLILRFAALLCLPGLFYVTFQGGEGARQHSDGKLSQFLKGPIYYLYGSDQKSNIEAFDNYFSKGAEIGVNTRKHAYQFYFFRDMPKIRFQPYSVAKGLDAVNKGHISGMVVSRSSEMSQSYRDKLIPTIFDRRQQFSLYVKDQYRFFEINKHLYGIRDVGKGYEISAYDLRTFMVVDQDVSRGRGLTPRAPVWATKQMELKLPTYLLSNYENGFIFSIDFVSNPEKLKDLTIFCGNEPVSPFMIKDYRLEIRVTEPACLPKDNSAMSRLVFSKSDGESIRMNSIRFEELTE